MSLLLFVSHQLQALQETHLHGRPLLQAIACPTTAGTAVQAGAAAGGCAQLAWLCGQRALHRCYLSLGKPTVVLLLQLVTDGSKQAGMGRATETGHPSRTKQKGHGLLYVHLHTLHQRVS